MLWLKQSRIFAHFLVLLAFWTSACGSQTPEEIRDFIAVNTLPDGEVETRIFYKGFTVKETTVGRGTADGIKFRQLATKKHLIQLIYSDGEHLQDCEIVHNKDQLNKFLSTYKHDLSNLIATSNLSVVSLDDQHQTLPGNVAHWLNYTELRDECRKRHKQLKQEALERKHLEEKHPGDRMRSKRSVLIVPGTLWCGDSNAAEKYSQLGAISMTDKCCRNHDFCKFWIPGFSTKYNYFNYRPFSLSHCKCDLRSKREIMDILRMPGTKWCGKGYSADKYTRLGGFSRTDMCCRRHDLSCPFWIGAFETKYNLFNWRINTIMHCSCDERFRACLKLVGTADANLVGKLFFNVVQTQCFVIKPKKVCMKRSWWSPQCEKFKHEKQAILRDNLPY